MAGGRNSSTYSRFACYGAGNEAAATCSSSTCLTDCSRFACSSRDAREASNGTSTANCNSLGEGPGSYSGFARYGAAATTALRCSPTAKSNDAGGSRNTYEA